MGLIVVPIVPSELDAWKKWINDMATSKSEEFSDFNNRMGITSHKVWLVQSPNGPLAVVSHEGPGEAEFMQKVTTSDHPFDESFKNSISGFHGIDFSQPPPGPMPEQLTNWNAE
jgi:hypothetical protein